jgi:hypothetical protein
MGLVPERSPPPPPEREPPPDRFRLRPPPDRAGVGVAGAGLPGCAGRVSPMAGRVSPTLGRSAGAVGADEDPPPGSATAPTGTVWASAGPTSEGTGAGRDATWTSSPAVSGSLWTGGLAPSPPAPVRLRPRPPREPRRLRLAEPGPPNDSPPAPSGDPPSADVAEVVELLGGPVADSGRSLPATAGDGEAGLAGRGASEAPGVCPVGTSDIGFLSETVHEARSMACWARSVPAGTTRPRSGS